MNGWRPLDAVPKGTGKLVASSLRSLLQDPAASLARQKEN
jgi:hypothetical protein